METYTKYTATKTSNSVHNGNRNQQNIESEDEEDELEDDDDEEASIFKFNSSPVLDYVRPENEDEDVIDIAGYDD